MQQKQANINQSYALNTHVYMHRRTHSDYHHGEDDGGLGGLDDPEQDQAAELNDGEEVHLPQWDVTKVDEVRLMFGRHAEQPQTVKELHRRKQIIHFSSCMLSQLVLLIKHQQAESELT